jgi:hypothetical protein
MKFLFSFFFFLFSISNPTITEIRKLYPNASKSESNSKEFALKLTDISTDDKTLVAYKGASITMVAKFKKKVSDKISTFKEGSKLIELAVASEPNNIEIRLIRLSVQENVPGIVKYKKNILEDKSFILKQYKEQSSMLKEYLKSYILQSKSFSLEEQKAIK